MQSIEDVVDGANGGRGGQQPGRILGPHDFMGSEVDFPHSDPERRERRRHALPGVVQRLPRAPELGRITKSDGREDTDTGDSEYRDGNPRRVQLHDGRIATKVLFQRVATDLTGKRLEATALRTNARVAGFGHVHTKTPRPSENQGIGTVLEVEAWCSGALARVADELDDH